MMKRKRRKKYRKTNQERYNFIDGVIDIAVYIPELIFLPFRLMWYLIRFLVRIFDWT
ncbi:hypothetical protein JOC75_002128 [Metabacillus crassostreae]|uniref:hypothetical protein n=1 Tax=Metabacillus crassostreae TaxID=929098 RepID=UPI00195AD52A|nr:hypothetical protein [Metabacillus crassostreae]MBM7604155.1 hypothetical protein [Metabacillus crassostreae]